jgi:hypothetical protein
MMQHFARIEDGAVAEVVTLPATFPGTTRPMTPQDVFTAEIASEMVACPANTQQGWLSDGSKFTPPPPQVVDHAGRLARAKGWAVQQIAEAADLATQPILLKYPTAERETWRKQEDEARAVIAGTLNASDAVFLMLLTGGVYQGVRPLAEKVVAKADHFKEVASQVISIRKAATEAVEAAGDNAAVDAALAEARAALEALD